jgi:hypothetical protein
MGATMAGAARPDLCALLSRDGGKGSHPCLVEPQRPLSQLAVSPLAAKLAASRGVEAGLSRVRTEGDRFRSSPDAGRLVERAARRMEQRAAPLRARKRTDAISARAVRGNLDESPSRFRTKSPVRTSPDEQTVIFLASTPASSATYRHSLEYHLTQLLRFAGSGARPAAAATLHEDNRREPTDRDCFPDPTVMSTSMPDRAVRQ